MSEELNPEDKFALAKAFGSLAAVDWNLVQDEIKRLLLETHDSSVKRKQSQEATSSVIAPFQIKDVTYNQAFHLMTWRWPQGSLVFVAFMKQKPYILDLTAQSVRPLKTDVPPSSTAFLKLKSGRLLVAYPIEKTLIIEDEASGELIESLDLPRLFPGVYDHNLPGRPQLYEDTNGHLIVFIEGNNSYRRMVYDTATKKAFITDKIAAPGDKWEGRSFPLIVSPATGRVLAWAPGGASAIIFELFEGGSRTLIDEPKEMDSSSGQFPGLWHDILPSGRTIFYSYDQNGFVLHDVDDKTLPKKVIPVNLGTLDLWPLKIIELPNGELKILSQIKKREGKNSVLAVIDTNSQIEEIPLPGSSQMGVKVGTSPEEHFPQFEPVNLQDGRTWLIGLATKSDSATSEYAAGKLYVVDLSNKEVSLLDVSRFDVGHFVGAYETDDKRIIGIFTRNGVLKTLQIFGPVPAASL